MFDPISSFSVDLGNPGRRSSGGKIPHNPTWATLKETQIDEPVVDMCGFAGFHSPRDFPAGADALARRMGDRLWRRGPDGAGEWIKPTLGIALTFRRLAIVDLSELGHQPMV